MMALSLPGNFILVLYSYQIRMWNYMSIEFYSNKDTNMKKKKISNEVDTTEILNTISNLSNPFNRRN